MASCLSGARLDLYTLMSTVGCRFCGKEQREAALSVKVD